MTTQTSIHIRWMIRRDLDEAAACLAHQWEDEWKADDIIKQLRQRNAIGMIAEENDRIAGVFLFELHKKSLLINVICVRYADRNKGIGTAIINKLKSKLKISKRTKLTIYVNEDNLRGLVFLKKHEFIATGTQYDQIKMEYQINENT